MKLEKQGGIPFYIQLKEQIRSRISSGQWPPGYKLPTERDLAGQVQVSRNTVGQAYKELETEGVLKSIQGRGTFVAEQGALQQRESRKEKVLRIIDTAMEEAANLGFTIDDFVSFVHVRGMEKKDTLSRLKVLFIESNPEQLEEFTRESYIGHEVRVLTLLIGDLLRDPERSRRLLDAIDMVVTTFHHAAVVKDFMIGLNVPVISISLEPKLETMVRIARLPGGSPLPLVCESEEFAAKVKTILNNAGLFTELMVITDKEEKSLTKILADAPSLLVSASRRRQVEKIRAGNGEIIEFRTFPDTGSLNLLRSALLELRERGSV